MKIETSQIPVEHVCAAQYYFLIKHMGDEMLKLLRYFGHTDGFERFRVGSFTEFTMKYDGKGMKKFMEVFISELNRVSMDVTEKAEYEEKHLREVQESFGFGKSIQRDDQTESNNDGKLARITLKVPKNHEKNRELYDRRENS